MAVLEQQALRTDVAPASVPSLYQETPGGIVLTPHAGQYAAWESLRRFVFIISGSQGGKTSFGPWWLYREIYGWDKFVGRGAGDYLAITATFDLFKLKMLPEVLHVFEHLMGMGRFWPGDGILELRDPLTYRFWAKQRTDPMWGRVILRSANAPGGLEAATAKAAWLDECGQPTFQLDAWQATRRRLAIHIGRVLGTTTPYNLGWLKTEIWDRWKAGDPEIDVINFPSTLNPMFPKEEFENMRRTMADWKFRMFMLGQMVRPESLILKDLTDELVQDVSLSAIHPIWTRYVGWDFGGVNTAVLWSALDPDTNILYVYRESLSGNVTTKEHAKRALEILASETAEPYGQPAVFSFGGAASEEQWRRDLGEGGWPVACPPIGGVEAGIDRIIQMLRDKRLIISKSCPLLLDQMRSYSRKTDESGTPTEEIENKESYHMVDALRYLCVGASTRFGLRS